MFSFVNCEDRSNLIVDRNYDEATTMDLKPMFPGPLPSPLSPSSSRRRQNSFRPSRRGDSVRRTFSGFLVQTSKGIEISVLDRIGRSSAVQLLKGHFPRGLDGARHLVAKGKFPKHPMIRIRRYANIVNKSHSLRAGVQQSLLGVLAACRLLDRVRAGSDQTRAGSDQKRAVSDQLRTEEESTIADQLRTEESIVAEQLQAESDELCILGRCPSFNLRERPNWFSRGHPS
ncbi:transcriptional regulator ATRX [Dorcoceras hygrometricum]|uniref:Transcriptional regulator ATRX n=1 Tax=Dorcoceras hygrometricum TaxID=472368 RepID=A0A2Z7CRK4_9LAMI|nr:transcriptional regulator ATRX [Dorcoceras hygrometricum]